MGEKGSTLIMTMFLIVVFSIFACGLSYLVLLDNRMAAYTQERLQAAYCAEAALAEARLEIEKDPDISTQKLEQISNNLEEKGEYEIKKAVIVEKEKKIIFRLTAQGKSGRSEETLRRIYHNDKKNNE